jgi:hypothetical protein
MMFLKSNYLRLCRSLPERIHFQVRGIANSQLFRLRQQTQDVSVKLEQ